MECSIEEDERTPCPTTLCTDISVKHYPEWGTKKVYVCPWGIYVYRGACDRQCIKARGDADAVYDKEPVSRWLVVKNGESLIPRLVWLAGMVWYVSTIYEYHLTN